LFFDLEMAVLVASQANPKWLLLKVGAILPTLSEEGPLPSRALALMDSESTNAEDEPVS